jgi:hypothetical protein
LRKLGNKRDSKLEIEKQLQEQMDTLLPKPQKQSSLFQVHVPFPAVVYRESCILETGYWHHAYDSVSASFLDCEDSPFNIPSHS